MASSKHDVAALRLLPATHPLGTRLQHWVRGAEVLAGHHERRGGVVWLRGLYDTAPESTVLVRAPGVHRAVGCHTDRVETPRRHMHHVLALPLAAAAMQGTPRRDRPRRGSSAVGAVALAPVHADAARNAGLSARESAAASVRHKHNLASRRLRLHAPPAGDGPATPRYQRRHLRHSSHRGRRAALACVGLSLPRPSCPCSPMPQLQSVPSRPAARAW